MSFHISRTYLNSCLKIPIDPCNNCPAPLYNRPKMYLGRLSLTPNTTNTAVITKHCNTTQPDTKWSCGGVRSLAKLYDSIPDYTDLNHLNGEEFNATLNTLRSTCRELKVKTSCFNSEDQCSTSTISTPLVSSRGPPKRGRSKKSKKSKKKKSYSESKKIAKCSESQQTGKFPNKKKAEAVTEPVETKACITFRPKSYKKDLDKEVEILKKSLDEFEAELKRPLTSLNATESRQLLRNSSKEYVNKAISYKKKLMENTFTPPLRDRLRKSLSFNDLYILPQPPELDEFRKQNNIEGESHSVNQEAKLSNYFKEITKYKNTKIPKIIVDSLETEKSVTEEKLKEKSIKNEEYKMPFKLFYLDTNRKGERSIKHSTPSPIHPVARPNLAATLRAESSKKKVQELKSNCTFHDTTAQFDWEVRKTPAWKTLSLNETHKQILQLRLDTRKVEQALQQREYELNMELMRQRVKSAPLLLEGPTHWGPNVGKLTHSCQKEGRHHVCHRTKRRKTSSRGHNCRRRLFSTTSSLEEENFGNSANTSAADIKHKMNELRKIYGSSNNIGKSNSRNSNWSTYTQLSVKRSNGKNLFKNEKKSFKADSNLEVAEIDSGDELSSLDRAFL